MRSLFKYILIAFTLCLFAPDLWAQGNNNPIANKGYYRTFNAGGGYIHTRGFGAYYRRGWRKTGYSNRILNVEVLSLKDAKEFKISYPGTQSRGYFYGKINSVAMIRGSYGLQKTLFDKEVKRGVRVSHFILYGPTFALVKPVYVYLNNTSGDGRSEQIVRYSTAVHNEGEVTGRAPILHKLGSTRIYPGAHIKYALNFEYSADDSFIRALETGASLDAFYKKIPIMENNFNDPIFLTLYVSFHFGKRYL